MASRPPAPVRPLAALALFLGTPALAHADVLYFQPPNTASGILLYSSYWDPDGSDLDEYAWDSFSLAHAADITEIRWRGGGTAVNEFEVSIYASIAAGIQPDLTAPALRHYMSGTTCGETYAGTFGGVPMYDYHFTLPTPFAASANTIYWVQIEAWTPSWPAWGLATGTGGNGSHFHRAIAITGDFRFYTAANDAAFTIIGTPTNCSSPTVTASPSPLAVCAGVPSAVLHCAAAGAGTLTYRWRRGGVPLYDGPHAGGASVLGSTTDTLTLQHPTPSDNGTYDCEIYNACGPAHTAGAAFSVAAGAPGIASQPIPASTCTGGTVALGVSAMNGPLAYAWNKDGVPVADGATPWGSTISGSATDTLTISAAQPGDAGSYACSVSNACSSITTASAVVAVCPADFDCNGFVNGDDFDAFSSEFYWGTPAADFDHNGFTNGDDFDAFSLAFEAGC